MSGEQRRIAVVGAGMSGVAAAHFLQQRGYEPEILEAESSLGGRAGSLRLGDKNIDIGGKNIGRKYRRFREFLAQHGSPPLEYFGINSSTVRNGRLHTVDSQKKLASLCHVLGLVGARDFWRLLRLGLLVRRDPAEGMLGGRRFSELAERKDHLPLSAWFREETVQAFLRPITLRMNGAEPDHYYYGCFGSNLRMLLDSYDQLSGGMSELLERFACRVPVSTGTRVTELIWSGRRAVGVELEKAGKREQRFYDAVVLALPAHQSARLLPREPVARALESVGYNPVTLVVARYRRPIFTERVRAIVFGRESPLSNAGCYGVRDHDLVRYTLSGGAALRFGEDSDPEEVLSMAETRLNELVPVSSSDRVGYVFKHFRHGLCAYGPFHHRVLAELVAWEASTQGLVLTGDYMRGASIEACFQASFEAVERLAERTPKPSLHLVRGAPSHNATQLPRASALHAQAGERS